MNIFPLRLLVNRTIRTLCPALLLLPIACNESGLTIRVIDPLTNVLPGIVCPPAGDDTVRVARGENAVLQFVISADDSVAAMNPVLRSLKTKQGASLDKAVLGWVRNVQASHAYVPAAPDALPPPYLSPQAGPLLSGWTFRFRPMPKRGFTKDRYAFPG